MTWKCLIGASLFLLCPPTLAEPSLDSSTLYLVARHGGRLLRGGSGSGLVTVFQRAGKKPWVFRGSPGGDEIHAKDLSDGEQIFIGSQAILSANGLDWEWTVGIQPTLLGTNAQVFWTAHHEAVIRLVASGTCTLAEFLRAEFHRFSWNDRLTWVVRLPLRDPSVEDRFREMWVFTQGASDAMPVARILDPLRLDKMIQVNAHYLHKSEDCAGNLRYAFKR